MQAIEIATGTKVSYNTSRATVVEGNVTNEWGKSPWVTITMDRPGKRVTLTVPARDCRIIG